MGDMLRGNFSDILAPGQYKIFVDDLEQWPEEYAMYYNVADSSKKRETGSSVSGFGVVPEKAEAATMEFDEALQGYDATFTHLSYVLGYRISEELYEDDLYGVMNQMPAELAKSFRYTVEVQGASVLNNGFTDSAAFLGPDGEPLFGDGTTKTHPLTGGSTGANQLATAADLSMDSAELMVEMLEATVNEKGLLAMLKAATFCVPPEERWNAKELFDPSGMMEKPQTTERGINPMKGEDINYFVGHFLTDPDAFFLKATDVKTQWFWRIKPGKGSIKFWDDNGPGVMNARGRMRSSRGWWDWRGWVGSPGA